MTQLLKNLNCYQTLVFDCDGVVLNSNKIKSLAFYEATKHFGHEPAQALVDYHIKNGGVSRYAKFDYFIKNILQHDSDKLLTQSLLKKFAQSVMDGLMTCDIAKGLSELKENTVQANWLIVSGGDQAELREVFKQRGLNKYFDGGIFGSPDTKEIILEREKNNKKIRSLALFLGDSKYDYQAAINSGLDFIFLSDWTEVEHHKEWCASLNLESCNNIKGLVKC